MQPHMRTIDRRETIERARTVVSDVSGNHDKLDVRRINETVDGRDRLLQQYRLVLSKANVKIYNDAASEVASSRTRSDSRHGRSTSTSRYMHILIKRNRKKGVKDLRGQRRRRSRWERRARRARRRVRRRSAAPEAHGAALAWPEWT